MDRARSLLWPHKTNNYQPHLLRLPGLLALLLLVGLLFLLPAQTTGTSRILGIAAISANELLASTNNHRASNSQPALKLSSSLSSAAAAKAQHMLAHDYWAHVSPDGVTPWYFMQQAGYAYDKAGENLAYGFTSGSEIVSAWMNSPGHKVNVLGDYTEVGFGTASGTFQGGENTIVVAMYAKPVPAAASKPARSSTAPRASTGGGLAEDSSPPETAEALPASDRAIDEQRISPVKLIASETSKQISTWQVVSNAASSSLALLISAGILLYLCLAMAYRHLAYVHNLVVRGEKILHHHPLLEAGLVYAATILLFTSTYGVIQ